MSEVTSVDIVPLRARAQPKRGRIRTGSWVSQLAISALAGLAYARWIEGPTPLNSRNVSWLFGDRATYYIGWALFRQDPHLHWPLMFTKWINYPIGDSVTFMDLNPLLAFVLKLLSPLLPSPFQYFGLEAVLVCTLQFFFGFRIFNLLTRGDSLLAALSSMLMLISPPLIMRLADNYTLANQWIIVAAIYLFLLVLTADGKHNTGLVCFSGILIAVAVGTNMYLALSATAIICAAACGVWRFDPNRWRLGAAILLVGGVAGFLSAAAFGLLRLDGAGAIGYRLHAANLLTFVNPGADGSILLPALPSGGTSHEGYAYLGLGLLLLAVVLVPTALLNFRAIRRNARILVPAAACCVFMMILAASTRVTVGPFVFDLDRYEHLTKYLSVFRASGRLAWTPYYFFVIGITAAIARWFPRPAAIALLSFALVLQVMDTAGVRKATRDFITLQGPNPLKSPVWSQLRRFHQNLILVPPFQCGGKDYAPGGDDSYRIFGLLAASDGLRTNSYYAARQSFSSLKFQCEELPRSFRTSPLSSDSAYVVDPTVAFEISHGPSGPNTCHAVDGFVLCSSTNDFGLPPFNPEIPVLDAESVNFGRNTEARKYFGMGWHNTEDWGVWSQGSGELRFRLTKQQLATYRYVRLNLNAFVLPHPAHYRIVCGPVQSAGVLAAPSPQIESFSLTIPLHASADGLVDIQVNTDDPIRPRDVLGGFDWRRLGLGLRSIDMLANKVGASAGEVFSHAREGYAALQTEPSTMIDIGG